MALRKAGLFAVRFLGFLTSKTVQCTSLTFQGIDNVHGCNSLSLGVLGVGHCISDDILKEDFEDPSGFFVDETADSLHTTPAGKTPDCWLGDSLDVVTENLPVTLSASLS